MNKTLKAADEVKKLARMFHALDEVVEVLDRVGSLDQAEQEAQARIDTLRKQHDQIVAESNLARVEAKRIMDEAKTFAEGLRGEAEALLAGAKANADMLVEGARDEADALMQSARVGVADAHVRVAEAEQAASTAANELADLHARIDAARAEIANLLAR